MAVCAGTPHRPPSEIIVQECVSATMIFSSSHLRGAFRFRLQATEQARFKSK
jgi:hypothetical protein